MAGRLRELAWPRSRLARARASVHGEVEEKNEKEKRGACSILLLFPFCFPFFSFFPLHAALFSSLSL